MFISEIILYINCSALKNILSDLLYLPLLVSHVHLHAFSLVALSISIKIVLFVFPSHSNSSFRWTVTSLPMSINPLSAICPKVSDAKSMTASLNPHFPPNGIWGHMNQTLLGYAHSHSDSSIRPRGSCRAPDWFLAVQWIDRERET